MNLYIIQIFLKLIKMLFLVFISTFHLNVYNENQVNVNNTISNQNSYAYNTLIIKEPVVSKKVVNENKVVNKQPSNIKTNNVKPAIQKKEVVKQVENSEKKEVVQNKPNVVNNISNVDSNLKEKKAIETFNGRMTGYGPDCVGCSKVGNVACMTREKKKHSLISDGIYYEDKEFGKVRILAAATTKFKCGTIVEVKKDGKEPFYGIVLDTGGSMRKAWANGTVWMDLAYTSNALSSSDGLTGKNITFNIYRYGW